MDWRFGLANKVILLLAWPFACANGQDAMQAWCGHAARVDSLYVEGAIESHRVPADKDVSNPANWDVASGFSLAHDFKLWLRRPDYRVILRSDAHGDVPESRTAYTKLDGRRFSRALDQPPELLSGAIVGDSPVGNLTWIPFLTPLEYQFFDVPQDNTPWMLAERPYEVVDGNIIVVQISKPGNWSGRIEVDPERDFCPKRLTLSIGEDPERRVIWDMTTLETRVVGGVHVVSKARMTMYNPKSNGAWRRVYLWEASKIVSQPITRADLEINFPDGTHVMDYTTNEEWVVGRPESRKRVDPEVFKQISEAIQGELLSPEIRARRTRTMWWIIVGAACVTAVVAFFGYRLRRARGGSV